MKKNPASQSGVFNLRVFLALLLCSGGVLLAMLGFAASTISSGMTTPAAPFASTSVPSDDTQKCAALTGLNLEDVLGGPALVTSARLVEVPPSGLEAPFFHRICCYCCRCSRRH